MSLATYDSNNNNGKSPMHWNCIINFALVLQIRLTSLLLETTHSRFCKNIARLASTNMLWESCSKFNLQQLSHRMFCKNIARLAVAMETCLPWFRPNEQYSYRLYYGKVVLNWILNNFPILCMFCKNIACLANIQGTPVSIATAK